LQKRLKAGVRAQRDQIAIIFNPVPLSESLISSSLKQIESLFQLPGICVNARHVVQDAGIVGVGGDSFLRLF
jgi:hypothetical protein